MSEFSRELTELIANLADELDAGLPERWRQIQELGLTTIGIDEARGGSGGELGDLVVVVRELARTGIAIPIVEAATAALAVGVPGEGTFDTIVVDKLANIGAATLSADLGLVPFAPLAGSLVVVGDSGVAALAMSQAGVTVEADTDLAGLPAGRVRLNGATYELVPQPPQAADLLERLGLLRAAALLGSACGAFELTRRYVMEREQFGAPLIKIPAVATAVAQMSVRIRGTRSAVERAVALCTDPDIAPLRRFGAVASARIMAAGMATLVARTAHQLHGAVGVTREYDLHHHTRRLWAWRDVDVAERVWSGQLGATAVSVDDGALWDQISA